MKIVCVISLLCITTTACCSSLGENLRKLQLSDSEIIEASESQKLQLRRRGVNFMDISNFPTLFGSKQKEIQAPNYSYPISSSHQNTAKEIINAINKQSMYDNLAHLSSFYTRYYKSETGYESACWLLENLRNVTMPLKDKIDVIQIDHHDWKQFSLIVRINGTNTPENIVVFGSHHDSMNLLLPSILAAPGADDNASGTSTNIEALRLYVNYLQNSGSWPTNTIEFHFYSAEEGGLLGSLDVFTRYSAEQRKVVAMLQQDMTGYVQDPKNEHVGVITDYTSPGLAQFTRMIIENYLSIPYRNSTCGYACSDHGSATKNGFPAIYVIESEYSQTNKYIHSTMDTLDRLSLDHMAEHVKLVIGFLLELGDWTVEEIKKTQQNENVMMDAMDI